MRSPLEKHISSLNKPFLDELVAEFSGFSWLSTTGQEYSALFIFDRHKVRWDLDVNHIRTVAMGSEIVHEQVVSVVYEEVQGIKHVSVVF